MGAGESRFQKDWKFSLLYLKGEKIEQLRRIPVGKWTSDLNFDSAILLLTKDFIGAEQRIKQVLLRDPEDIQAWNNKGYLLEIQGKAEEAVEAMRKRENLFATNPVKAGKAKVEYAYWLHNTIRLPSENGESLALLWDVFTKAVGDDVEQHFLFLKVLSSEVRHTCGNQEQILLKWIDELKWFMERGQEELLIWMEITVTLHHCCRKRCQSGIHAALARLGENLEIEKIDMNFCAEQLHHLVKTRSGDNLLLGNMYAKAGKALAYADKEYIFEDIDNAIKRVLRALNIAEWYSVAQKARFDMGPKVCGEMLLDLWVIMCYKKHGEVIQKNYRDIYGDRPQSRASLFMFVKNSYYPETEDISLKEHLDRAKEHLQRHVDQETADWTWMWPRVLALLNENSQTVEEAFHQRGRSKTHSTIGTEAKNVAYHMRLAEYLEYIGDVQRAKENFLQAVTQGETSGDNIDITPFGTDARFRLDRLKRQLTE